MSRVPPFALALAGILCLCGPVRAEDKPARPAVPVVLADVVAKEVRRGRSFVGSVEPERRGHVGSQIAGYVDKLLVEAGDPVEAGATIASLCTKTIDIRIAAAGAELTLRQKELLELKNGSRREEIAEAVARIDEAEAEVETARWKLEALQKLRKDELISEEELREAQKALAAAKARTEARRSLLKLLREGPRAERIAQAEARVAIQQAVIATLEDEKARHEIKAPYAGFVVTKNTELGTWIALGDPVVEVVGLQLVDVVIPMLEDDLIHVRRGMKVNVQIDALPEKFVDGVIHRIVPAADARSRTAPVKIRITNTIEDGRARIKPGMFARVTLPVGEAAQALVVPKDAIVLGRKTPIVYVFNEEDQGVRPVPVELGAAIDDGIVVEGELEGGMKVVIRGNERLRPGMRVRPVAATR